jgi:hypothetical protein
MSCIIDNGYELSCASVGGVELVYIGTYDADAEWSLSVATASLNVVTGVTGLGNPVYNFEQDLEYAGVSQPIVVNRENGTVHFTTDLTVKFVEMDFELRNTVVALARAPIYAIVKSNAGHYYLLCAESAGRLSEGTADLGTAFEDMNGATLTFQFKSKNGLYLLDETLLGTAITIA